MAQHDVRKSPDSHVLAVVGASAGGLEAFRLFLGALPATIDVAFLFVQHLDPQHESRLAELLQSVTPLKVVRGRNGSRLRPGCVVVVPEARTAAVVDGALVLRPRVDGGHERPIDMLFTSVAESGANVCGVLLSGQGTDGTEGLGAILGAGGVTFVQDPTTTPYAGMPEAAIAADVADFVGSPEEIAHQLAAIVRGGRIHKPMETPGSPAEAAALSAILETIERERGLDFARYKIGTVRRRVGRRALLRGAESLAEYAAILDEDPEEAAALVGDMLIHVTEFFRDPLVFEALRRKALPEVLAGKDRHDTVRIWVPGCSTGEEVYSLLIELAEAMEPLRDRPKVLVFGTDLSERAVAFARAGVYAERSCKNISPERLARFFHRVEGGFQVRESLRESCVFAVQDITRETPFSRLDLVSMRNLLIYMEQDLQRKVLAIAHYALVPDGLLVLGTSETADASPGLFKPFDAEHHVFRRKNAPTRLPLGVIGRSRIAALDSPQGQPPAPTEVTDVAAVAEDAAHEMFLPPRVVIDAGDHVLYFFGDTSPYLEHAEGRATFDLLEIARENVALSLREALEASRAGEAAERTATYVSGGVARSLVVSVTPITSPPDEPYRLVAFVEGPEQPIPSGLPDEIARLYEERSLQMRQEIARLRARIRGQGDDTARSQQSLQAANEEIRSSNEELQSINEELETSKEELQSVNEELTTVNDELRERNQDLSLANDDISNFIASADVPLIMLDCDLRVRRYTPQAERIAALGHSDIGRQIERLKMRVVVPDLVQLVTDAVERSQACDREVCDEAGRWYAMQVRPYIANDDTHGAVISFLDIDERKRAMEAVELRARLAVALSEIDAAIGSTLDIDEIMQRSLEAGVRALGVEAGAVEVREGDAWVIRYQDGFKTDVVGQRLSDQDAPNATTAARTRVPLVITDMSLDPVVNVGFVRANTLKSVIAIPLIVRGVAFGSLLLYCRTRPRVFGPAEVEFAARLGTAVSLSLENARLFEAEMHAARTAGTLSKVNEILLSALTVADVISRLVGEASEAAGAEKAAVIRIDGDVYTVTDVREISARGVVGVPREGDYYPAFKLAVEARVPIMIGDTWTDAHTNKAFVVPNQLRAFQLLPLMVEGRVAHVLALAWSQTREFDAEDRESAQRMAVGMSAALTNAELYEAEQRAQSAARSELEFSQVLLDASSVLADWTDLDRMLDRLADVLLRHAGHDRVTIALWDEQARTMTSVVSKGTFPMQGAVTRLDEMSPAGRRMMRTKRTVMIDYAKSRNAALRRLVSERNLRYALAVPVVARGRVLGSIVVDAPSEWREFSEREVALVEAVASHAAVAIENANLFRAEVAARAAASQELETTALLLRGSTALAESPDLASSLRRGLGALSDAIPGVRTVVYALLPETSELQVLASTGGAAPPDGARIPLERMSSAAPRLLKTKKRAVIDFDALPADQHGIVDAFDVHLLHAVPLLYHGDPVGILVADDPASPRRRFTPREFAIVEAMASQVAATVVNGRLFEAERTSRERESALRHAAVLAASSLDVTVLATTLVRSLAPVLGAEQAQLRLVNADGTALESAGAVDPGGFLQTLGPMPVDAATETAACFRDHVSRVVSDIAQVQVTKASARNARGAKVRAYVLMPVMVGDRAIGTFYAAWREPRSFTPDDVAFIESVVAQLTSGLQNARLYAAEIASQARLQQELRTTDLLLLAGNALAGVTDLSELLEKLADVVLGAASHSRVTLDLWDESRREITLAASKGEHALPTGGVFAFETLSAAAKEVIESHQARVFDYGAEDPANKGPAVAAANQVRLAFMAPILYRGRVSGLIIVDSPGQRIDFSEREIALIRGIADQAAVAIENARLFEAERLERSRSDLLREIGEEASRSLDAHEISRCVLEMVAQDAEFAAGGISALYDAGDSMRMRALSVLGYPAELAGAVADLPVADDNNPGRVALHGLDILTSDDPGNPPESEARLALMGLPDARWIVLPIRAEGRLLGTLGLTFRGHRSFEEAEIALYCGIATTLGPLLRNAQLYSEITQSSQRLTAHIDNSPLAVVEFDSKFRIVRWSDEAEHVFGWAADEVLGKAIGEFKWVWDGDVELVDDESTRLREGTGRSFNLNRNYRKDGSVIWCEWYDSAVYDADGNLVSVFSQVLDVTKRRAAEEALRVSETRYRQLFANMLDGFAYCRMVFDELDRPSDFVYVDVNASFERLTGLKGVVGKPVSAVIPGIADTNPELLETYGRVVKTGEPAYFETEIDPLGLVLAITVYRPEEGHFVAIFDNITESKRAEAERAERERLNGALAEIGTAVSATLDSDEILERLLDASARALDVDTAGLASRQGQQWVVKEYFGSGKRRPTSALTDPGLDKAVLAANVGEPIVIDDTADDARVDPARMKRMGIRSLMALPVVVQNQVVAALVYHHRREARAFSSAQIGFATRLTAVLALALENARLFRTERDIADRLQEALLLLPPEVPGLEFAHAYSSATESTRVGGDFYDLFELDDRHVGITVGDVAGKGIDAAVLTSLARHTIRAYATEMHDRPGRVLQLANEVVFKATPVESFLTVFYGVLDRTDGSLRYASASHTTGAVAEPDGKVARLGATGTLLGAFTGVRFEERTERLGADSLLFLYTDGLTEARNDGELYGEERLFAYLATKAGVSTEQVVRDVVDEVREFSGDHLRDDLAILALKLVPPVAGCEEPPAGAPKATRRPGGKPEK